MKVNISDYGTIDRKVNVHIDKSDTYSLDHTLAYIILPGLLAIKENKAGIPGEFADTIGGEKYSSQYCFDFYNETYDEMFEKYAVASWEEVLDKMIWSFEQLLQDDWESKYHYGQAKYVSKETDEPYIDPITNKPEKCYIMVDTNPDEHWMDFAGMEEHRRRIQEGFELFGKYYQNLWT